MKKKKSSMTETIPFVGSPFYSYFFLDIQTSKGMSSLYITLWNNDRCMKYASYLCDL